jgi:hypothetical protein
LSLIQAVKLTKAVDMLIPSATALRDLAQSYLDDRADSNDATAHWSFDEHGHGTKKTGAELRKVHALSHQQFRVQAAMQITEALAADIARTAIELDALRTRIEELRKVYALPEKPPGRQCMLEDLG